MPFSIRHCFLLVLVCIGLGASAKTALPHTDTTQTRWWNETVFYEIFVRSFYDSDGDGIGDFQGLIQKLDYLNDGDPNTSSDLGIGGIWLMPISPSPSYHGYDVTDYRGINPDYGTMQDFEDFLQAAHDRGIKVIVDMVINHSSSQHPWFIDSRNSANGKRNFYRWSTTNPGYNGPWGQQVWHFNNGAYFYGLFWGGMPDLNYAEPQVADSIFDIADHWLTDIGVDGFRLDAIKFIHEDGPILEDTPATIQFWKDYKANAEAAQSGSLLVGEAWTNTAKVVDYVQNDGLDICFEFDLATAILNSVNVGNADALQQKMDEVYSTYPANQWGTFLTNHDMNRVYDQLNQSWVRNKLAAAIYLSLPGVPFIYYGEEIGMRGEKPDPDIRRPMQWTSGSNAGFTTGSPWHGLNSNYSSFNVADEMADPGSILSRYRRMVAIRNLKPALQTGSYLHLPTPEASVFAFLRATPTDTALLVANLSGFPHQNLSVDVSGTGLNGGTQDWWEMLGQEFESLTIDVQDSLYIGDIEGFGFKAYSPDQVFVQAWKPQEQVFEVDVHPNPAKDVVHVNLEGPGARLYDVEVFDSKGKKLRESKGLRKGESTGISLGDLPAGTYLLLFRTEKGQVSKRLVKK